MNDPDLYCKIYTCCIHGLVSHPHYQMIVDEGMRWGILFLSAWVLFPYYEPEQVLWPSLGILEALGVVNYLMVLDHCHCWAKILAPSKHGVHHDLLKDVATFIISAQKCARNKSDIAKVNYSGWKIREIVAHNVARTQGVYIMYILLTRVTWNRCIMLDLYIYLVPL